MFVYHFFANCSRIHDSVQNMEPIIKRMRSDATECCMENLEANDGPPESFSEETTRIMTNLKNLGYRKSTNQNNQSRLLLECAFCGKFNRLFWEKYDKTDKVKFARFVIVQLTFWSVGDIGGVEKNSGYICGDPLLNGNYGVDDYCVTLRDPCHGRGACQLEQGSTLNEKWRNSKDIFKRISQKSSSYSCMLCNTTQTSTSNAVEACGIPLPLCTSCHRRLKEILSIGKIPDPHDSSKEHHVFSLQIKNCWNDFWPLCDAALHYASNGRFRACTSLHEES